MPKVTLKRNPERNKQFLKLPHYHNISNISKRERSRNCEKGSDVKINMEGEVQGKELVVIQFKQTAAIKMMGYEQLSWW